SVDLNLAYLVRLLADHRTDLNERTLSRLYNAPHGFTGQTSPVINRDIVVAMANWRANYWLSNLKNTGSITVAHPWVRRAFCVAAPTLGDEGQFWYRANSRGLSDLDRLSYG